MITGVNIVGDLMRKLSFGTAACAVLVAASSAFAADMPPPVYKAPPVMAPVFSWTGWYVGVNGGGGFGRNQGVDVTETFAGALFVSGTWPGFGNFGTLKPVGPFAGGQIGYNWQTGSWVFGIETDLQWASIRDSQIGTITPYIVAPNSITVATSERLGWFGTLRGRIGYAWDRLLLYATGGFGYGNVKYSLNMIDTFGFTATNNFSSTRTGYVVGGGMEYAFTPNWTGKVEYQYLNLGSATIAAAELLAGAPTAFAVATNAKFDFHTFRVGLNYKF